MSKGTVYLAGPILGQTESEAKEWRAQVDAVLAQFNIVGISPLRCEPITGDTYQDGGVDDLFGSTKGVFTKNLFDVKNCDVVLAYLPSPKPGKHYSWGTIMEVAWGRAFDKPVILVSDDPAVRNHAVLKEAASWIVKDFDDAAAVCVGLLAGYNGGKNL